ncbi:MAG TPA: dynamin-like GTPase family protein [Mycobacterium sp.]|nr:dynamin-like GTPase family protein [Mycobacterium sp.]
MKVGEQVRGILEGTRRAYRADPGYRNRPDVLADLDRIGARLNEPIRIALAGTLKSGKSTLLNALLGEAIAPTDATEATRLVTWFRHGPVPRVTANRPGGVRTDVPIVRDPGQGGALGFALTPTGRTSAETPTGLSGLDPNGVIDLDVEWPAAGLADATLVDTPGTSSLTPGVSERTLRLLVPEDGVPRIDAVVFLLRTLNAADIALLTRIGELVGGSAGALGVIGVASRADEIGSGRIDAILSAAEVAERYTAELERTGVCQAVVPVSGLLALTARTLRQDEFAALRALAEVDAGELNAAMLSADRFVRGDGIFARGDGLPLDQDTRARLLDRFGMFGLRISMALLRSGVTDSVTLAEDLLRRSGLVALREVIDQHVAQRADLLKAHSALVGLRRFVERHPIAAGPRIFADIDPLLADAHAFEELRLLSQLRSRPTTFTDDEMASLRRILGGSGIDAAARLGLSPSDQSDGPRAAFAAAQRWRRRADHPLNDPFTARACRAAVRSAEALVVGYAAR